MSCLTGDCAGAKCLPAIISPHVPPRAPGGWTLRGWPDFVPLHFRTNFRGEAVWPGNTPNAAVGSLSEVLTRNGVQFDRAALCDWANEQWCEADPARCQKARSKDYALAAKRKFSLIADSMQWATPFWQIFNVAVSDHGRKDSEVSGILDAAIFMARHLVRGNSGCSSCANHFDQLLTKYPPERVGTWRDARVWLWRVHNESRSNGTPVSYYNIATIYGWDELSDAEVMEIIERLRAE